MKSKLFVLIALFSFILNLTIISIWAYHKITVGTSFSKSTNKPAVDLSAPCALHRSVGVTDSQWKKIRVSLSAFSDSSSRITDSIDTYRYMLIDILSKEHIDTTELNRIQEHILDFQRNLQHQVISYMQKEKDVLTHEQKVQFYSAIRARWFSSGNRACFSDTMNSSGSRCGRHLHK
ncbi:MAG: Spy/CpxP family protein refolding chaperone [Fibrobacterota bacterium]|nr:hypothetical protein [Chitinispirillaceae bacterium]